jgi:hypothetical protein
MDVREKLVEIIQTSVGGCARNWAEVIADGLIAHGVTVQEWISVKDRLPDTIPCGAGTAYSEAVNVLTDGRKVLTAIWNGSHWICDAEFWDAEFEEITHWTPVLLPLPQPPKGE